MMQESPGSIDTSMMEETLFEDPHKNPNGSTIRDKDWESHALSETIRLSANQMKGMQPWTNLWTFGSGSSPGEMLRRMLTTDEVLLHELSKLLPVLMRGFFRSANYTCNRGPSLLVNTRHFGPQKLDVYFQNYLACEICCEQVLCVVFMRSGSHRYMNPLLYSFLLAEWNLNGHKEGRRLKRLKPIYFNPAPTFQTI